MIRLFNRIKIYLVGITIFYMAVSYLPNFSNQFYAPKLLILLFFNLFNLILILFLFFKKKKNIMVISTSHLLLTIFLISQLISAVFSQAPLISLFGYYKNEGLNYIFILAVIIFTLLTSSTIRKKTYLIVLNFYIGGTTISSLAVIFQHLYFNINRPTGLEGHPIWSASVIALSIVILLALPTFNLIANNYKKLIRLVRYFFILIHLVALVYLDSTLVFVDLSIALIIMTLIKYFNWYKKIKTIYLLFILFFFLGTGLLFTFQIIKKEEYSIFKRIQEIKMVNKLFASELLNHNIIQSFFGRGQSTSGFYLLRYKDENDPFDKEWLYNRSVIHNQFLEILWSGGVFGFFIWTYLLIKALKNIINEKKHEFISVWIFFAIWQLVYVLTPTLTLFYFLFLFTCLSNKKKLSISVPNLLSKSFLITLFLIFSAIFYLTFRGEFLYSSYQKQKAQLYQFWNEVFIQDNFNAVSAELNTCQRNLTECNQYTIKYIISRLSDLAVKKLSVNKLNPENWKDLGTALFYQYYYHDKKNSQLFNRAFDAVHYALSLYPTNYYYYDIRGALYLEKGEYQKAEHDFLTLLNKNPRYLSTIRHLIELYKQTGNNEKKQYYENILTTNNVPACLW